MPLEEMSAFFSARVDGYDEHMLGNIEGIAEGYARMAALLPARAERLLDLGCGTGLELTPIFARFPSLQVTGIDLTQAMLDRLARKFPDKRLTLVCGSYFDVPFEKERFDAAISFETMHHFSHDEKRGLYARIAAALQPGGCYLEADYMAATQAEEDALFAERERLLADMPAPEGFWHFDTPCTVARQTQLLQEAGFSAVQLAWQCGSTAILVARR